MRKLSCCTEYSQYKALFEGHHRYAAFTFAEFAEAKFFDVFVVFEVCVNTAAQSAGAHSVNYPHLLYSPKQSVVDKGIDVCHRFVHSLTDDVYFVGYAAGVYLRFRAAVGLNR